MRSPLAAAAVFLSSCAAAARSISDSSEHLATNGTPVFWGFVVGFVTFVITVASGGSTAVAGGLGALSSAVAAVFSHRATGQGGGSVVTYSPGCPWWLFFLALLYILIIHRRLVVIALGWIYGKVMGMRVSRSVKKRIAERLNS